MRECSEGFIAGVDYQVILEHFMQLSGYKVLHGKPTTTLFE
jgi:hypothetical protein